MTEVWDNEGGAVQSKLNKDDANEAVVELTAKVSRLEEENADLEATVEGLGQENSELVRENQEHQREQDRLKVELDKLADVVGKHLLRYKNAISLIERKDEQVRAFSSKLLQLKAAVINLTGSVKALKDVPESQLAESVDHVAKSIDDAVMGR